MNIQKAQRQLITQHLIIQAAIALCVVLATAIFVSASIALSLLLGALAAIVPNAYFGWRITRQTGAQHAKAILRGVYRGEIAKLLITGAIFGLIFKCIPVTIAPVFIGFISALVAFWVSLLILRSRRAVASL